MVLLRSFILIDGHRIILLIFVLSPLNYWFSVTSTVTYLYFLQVSYEGDPEGAVICFANNAQAFAAYRSSEPVFNNRFIKVFWHKPKDKKDQVRECVMMYIEGHYTNNKYSAINNT